MVRRIFFDRELHVISATTRVVKSRRQCRMVPAKELGQFSIGCDPKVRPVNPRTAGTPRLKLALPDADGILVEDFRFNSSVLGLSAQCEPKIGDIGVGESGALAACVVLRGSAVDADE